MNKTANAWVLVFLAFSAWFGLLTDKLPKLVLSGTLLSQISLTGLINLFFIVTVSACLLVGIIPVLKQIKITWLEGCLLLWPFLHLINLRRIDASSIVSLENSFFLTILLFTLFHKEELREYFSPLFSWGVYVFGLSYLSAIVMPFIFTQDTSSLFKEYYLSRRFHGWIGPVVTGFSGTVLAVTGVVYTAKTPNRLRPKLMGIFLILLGFIGLQLSVLRMGLIAFVFVQVFGSFQQFFKKNYFPALVFTLFSVVGAVSIMSPDMRKKSIYLFEKDFVIPKASAPKPTPIVVPAPVPPSIPKTSAPKPDVSAPVPPSIPKTSAPKPDVPAPVPPSIPKTSAPAPINPITNVPNAPDAKRLPIVEPTPRPQPIVKPPFQFFETINKIKSQINYFPAFLDRVIQKNYVVLNDFSNGRIELTKVLISHLKGHWFFGVGSGGAARYLKKNHSCAEPHNDYLRVLVDHGLVGLLIILSLLSGVLWKMRRKIEVVLVIGFALLMLTDNFMVYPIFGYGPLFLAGLFMAPSETKLP